MRQPPQNTSRRPLRLFDLMALVMASAFTLIAPAVIKAIIPAASLASWDRRQYVSHLSALILIGWTVPLVAIVLLEGRARLRDGLLGPGAAAVLASAFAFALLALRQCVVLVVVSLSGAADPAGPFAPRLFDVLEHAPDCATVAVLVAWTALALTGSRSQPRDWFERLCLLIGLAWALMGIVVVPVIWYLPVPWLMTSGIHW